MWSRVVRTQCSPCTMCAVDEYEVTPCQLTGWLVVRDGAEDEYQDRVCRKCSLDIPNCYRCENANMCNECSDADGVDRYCPGGRCGKLCIGCAGCADGYYQSENCTT